MMPGLVLFAEEDHVIQLNDLEKKVNTGKLSFEELTTKLFTVLYNKHASF